MKLSVKDEANRRANILLYGKWAGQGACIKKSDVLLISGAVLLDLQCDWPP